MYMYFVGFMDKEQAAHWRSPKLKIHFRSFFNTWSSNNHNGDGSINGTTKRLHIHVRFSFIVYFFVCFMQNNVELKFKLKVLWRTQTFSPHEIHIKTTCLNTFPD